MFYKNYKKYLPLVFLLFIGSISPVLFIVRSPIVFTTKKIPISPLPLVFDSPNGFNYWAYTVKMNFQMADSEFTIVGDKKNLDDVRRGWISHIFYHLIFGTTVFNSTNETKEVRDISQTLMCDILLVVKEPSFKGKKILKATITVFDQGKELKRRSYLCP